MQCNMHHPKAALASTLLSFAERLDCAGSGKSWKANIMVLKATTRSALAKGSGARQIANTAAEMLALQGTGGTLGFIYATDALKARLPDIARLRSAWALWAAGKLHSMSRPLRL